MPNRAALDICERVKEVGYAPSQTVKLYGRKYEVVSDPFPEEDGIAIRVKTSQNADVRTLRIPSTVLQGVFRQAAKKAS
jgi:hypothetical protein